jgi:hypothetical protein
MIQSRPDSPLLNDQEGDDGGLPRPGAWMFLPPLSPRRLYS